MGPLGERLGASFGRLGGASGRLHSILRLLGDVLAPFGLGSQKSLKPMVFSRFLKAPRSVLGPLGCVLARRLGVLEAPRGVLEGILELLGDVLARLGARKPEIIKNP